ncbi:MAG TPA: hypothetical protein PKY78_02265 [Candidatus Omnitrophota bacterium]|nr:hypothetical protein [Candidatus Omnitrophota bacterium]HPS19798.1 hypothetical protein [Candidatus Omnitrophota bacterium]
MKAVIVMLFSIFFAVNVFGGDLVKLDESNVKKFIEVYPEYKALMLKYGENANPANGAAVALKYKAEVDALLQTHGLTFEEFPIIASKIGYGLSAAAIKEQGMSPEAFGFKNYVTEDEINVVLQNKDKLQEILAEDAPGEE